MLQKYSYATYLGQLIINSMTMPSDLSCFQRKSCLTSFFIRKIKAQAAWIQDCWARILGHSMAEKVTSFLISRIPDSDSMTSRNSSRSRRCMVVFWFENTVQTFSGCCIVAHPGNPAFFMIHEGFIAFSQQQNRISFIG